jgi:hypothetical protein
MSSLGFPASSTKVAVCCKDLDGVGPFTSPFDVKRVWEYWDGEVSGFLQCGECRRHYSFRMLDHRDFGFRVYSLGRLSTSEFAEIDRISELLRSRSVLGEAEEASEADRVLVLRLIEKASPWRILAWTRGQDGILAAKPVTRNMLPIRSFDLHEWHADRDWFSVLGLDPAYR